jgi:hypothetical protein
LNLSQIRRNEKREMRMANICKNTITIIGLKEAPEIFAKGLSKVMFGIDLDNMDPRQWGEDESVDGTTWYAMLTEEYRREGVYAVRYGVLYPHERYSRLGVTAPRFYVETKWKAPLDEVLKASREYSELTFHLAWWLMQDGPVGEFVVRNGEFVESIKRNGSWYLFDWAILYPSLSLLPAHLPYTLAQRGALRVEDAINTIEDLRQIFDDARFTESPYQHYRDHAKVEQTRKTLDGVLEQMQKAASQLNFEGVFVAESGSQKEESVHRGESD